MTLDKKDWDKIDKRFGRYTEVMAEEFRSQLSPVIEMQKEQGKKINSLYEMTAQNTEDIAIIKSYAAFIKQELKQKVDRDEFNSLEKRVILLEQKLRHT